MSTVIYQQQHLRRSESESSMSSHDSDHSRDTVPGSVPSLDHRTDSVESKFADSPYQSELFEYDSRDPRVSVDTYCTTVVSYEDLPEEDEVECRFYDHYARHPDVEAVPATPQEFANLFPSTRRLLIKHDDSTLDGNMNLRVDAQTNARGEKETRVTLFHLRMYDLRDRDFSLRRYGRDCGREVAHIRRKFAKPVMQRPALQRSVSKALHSFRGKQEAEQQFKLNRQDSGYSSGGFDEDEEEGGDSKERQPPTAPKATNTCTLEFSNYAHVELSRRGGKASKKYDFEYWGKSYSWKRATKQVGNLEEEVSYHLVNNATNNLVAYIQPDVLTPAMAAAEEAKGGFVPPCSMHLKNTAQDPINSDTADIADVIVATGINALVDDCIKRKFHKKRTVQLVLPVPMAKSPLKMNMEYVGPKKLIDEMFNRRPGLSRSQSSQHTELSNSRASTPMRPMRARTS